MQKLGEKIWRLREEKGLSQEALAEKLEVSRQTVSNWENDRATPDAYKLKQLCEELGVSADVLLEMGESDPVRQEKNYEPSKDDVNVVGRRTNMRVLRIVLLAVFGFAAAFLLAIAIVLFALPEEKTQVVTSVFTLTPTMGGIILLVLAAVLIVAATVIMLKRK